MTPFRSLLLLGSALALAACQPASAPPAEAPADAAAASAEAMTEAPPPSSPAPHLEHARVAVTKRIKDSIKRIAANHPALGYHLRTAVRTGYQCRYEPAPGCAGQWEV